MLLYDFERSPIARLFCEVFSGLITLAVADEDCPYGHKRGRHDEDEDSAFERLNHATACGRGLRVAEGTALGGSGRNYQQQNCGSDSNEQDGFPIHDCVGEVWLIMFDLPTSTTEVIS